MHSVTTGTKVTSIRDSGSGVNQGGFDEAYLKYLPKQVRQFQTVLTPALQTQQNI